MILRVLSKVTDLKAKKCFWGSGILIYPIFLLTLKLFSCCHKQNFLYSSSKATSRKMLFFLFWIPFYFLSMLTELQNHFTLLTGICKLLPNKAAEITGCYMSKCLLFVCELPYACFTMSMVVNCTYSLQEFVPFLFV